MRCVVRGFGARGRGGTQMVGRALCPSVIWGGRGGGEWAFVSLSLPPLSSPPSVAGGGGVAVQRERRESAAGRTRRGETPIQNMQGGFEAYMDPSPPFPRFVFFFFYNTIFFLIFF